MAIDFKCKKCATTLRVPEEHLGKTARCPQCQELNLVRPDPMYIDEGQPPVKYDTVTEPQPPAPSYQPPVSTYPPARQQYQVAHRGGLILTLGILSIVCNVALVPGILAWIMGRSDLKQMRQGIMDREGEGLTQAGMIMGIIMTSLAALFLLMYLGFFILAMIFAVAGNMN